MCLQNLQFAAASTSFSVTSELVVSQKALIACAEFCIEFSKSTTQRQSSFLHTSSFFPYLKNRLSISAGRVLQHEWDDDGQGKNIKNKVSYSEPDMEDISLDFATATHIVLVKQGDVLQQLIRIFLQYNDSPLELLEELASNIMPQVNLMIIMMYKAAWEERNRNMPCL